MRPLADRPSFILQGHEVYVFAIEVSPRQLHETGQSHTEVSHPIGAFLDSHLYFSERPDQVLTVWDPKEWKGARVHPEDVVYLVNQSLKVRGVLLIAHLLEVLEVKLNLSRYGSTAQRAEGAHLCPRQRVILIVVSEAKHEREVGEEGYVRDVGDVLDLET